VYRVNALLREKSIWRFALSQHSTIWSSDHEVFYILSKQTLKCL